jgi:hypothetical protein
VVVCAEGLGIAWVLQALIEVFTNSQKILYEPSLAGAGVASNVVGALGIRVALVRVQAFILIGTEFAVAQISDVAIASV